MSHLNNMHTWLTAKDFDECERVLHKSGDDAAYRAELRLIRKRKDEKRAEAKREHARVQGSLFTALLALMLACTPIQARTARDVGAGAGALACAVAGAAAGQPWAAIVGAVGCALERLLARRGTMEAANVAQIPLLEALTELELAYDRAKRTGLEADALAAEAARVEADRLAVEYWGTP